MFSVQVAEELLYINSLYNIEEILYINSLYNIEELAQ